MALDVNGHLTIDWPCDCDLQAATIKTLLEDIEAQDTLIQSAGRSQLQIFSKNPPSIAQWQTQWILQGNTLPIPDGVEMLWFDTTNNTYGAQYYSVGGSVYPVEMIRYRGLENYFKDVSVTPSNMGTPALGNSVTGLLHWNTSDNGTGSPGAASFTWNIPAHLLGKSYFVRFNVPFWAAMSVNWTIWYENTNFYNTLYGGTGQSGFGIIATSSNQGLVEWTAEIPAGGVVATIEIRIAASSAGGLLTSIPAIAGLTNGTIGRTTAEFILKTE